MNREQSNKIEHRKHLIGEKSKQYFSFDILAFTNSAKVISQTDFTDNNSRNFVSFIYSSKFLQAVLQLL